MSNHTEYAYTNCLTPRGPESEVNITQLMQYSNDMAPRNRQEIQKK